MQFPKGQKLGLPCLFLTATASSPAWASPPPPNPYWISQNTSLFLPTEAVICITNTQAGLWRGSCLSRSFIQGNPGWHQQKVIKTIWNSVLQGNAWVHIYLAINSWQLPSGSPPPPQSVSPPPCFSQLLNSLTTPWWSLMSSLKESCLLNQTLRSPKARCELGRSMDPPSLSSPCSFRSCLLGWDIWVVGMVWCCGGVAEWVTAMWLGAQKEGIASRAYRSELSRFASQCSTNH